MIFTRFNLRLLASLLWIIFVGVAMGAELGAAFPRVRIRREIIFGAIAGVVTWIFIFFII
jgi:hypothetical protein